MRQNTDEKISNLTKLAWPVAEFLWRNYDPHCTVIITSSDVRLVSDEIGIPLIDWDAVEVDSDIAKQYVERKSVSRRFSFHRIDP